MSLSMKELDEYLPPMQIPASAPSGGPVGLDLLAAAADAAGAAATTAGGSNGDYAVALAAQRQVMLSPSDHPMAI